MGHRENLSDDKSGIYIGPGWGNLDRNARWTIGPSAEFIFGLADYSPDMT